MIEVTNYEIETEGSHEVFKLFYTYNGKEDITITTKLSDNIFRTAEYNGRLITLPPGVHYWSTYLSNSYVTDKGGKKYLQKFNHGVFVQFFKENGEVLHEEEIKFSRTDLNKRTHNNKFSHSTPIVWVIGDSNIGHLIKGIEESELICNNVNVNYVSHMALSLNRFLKSDYKTFLNNIPIRKGDTLMFLLGEIDLRFSIHKNSQAKGISLTTLLNQILSKYSKFLDEIKILYPNKIGVLIPPPPIPEVVVNSPDMARGTEEDRKYLYKIYKQYFEDQYTQNKIEFVWDCYINYINADGVTDPHYFNERLYEFDQHINDGSHFITSLKSKINETHSSQR